MMIVICGMIVMKPKKNKNKMYLLIYDYKETKVTPKSGNMMEFGGAYTYIKEKHKIFETELEMKEWYKENKSDVYCFNPKYYKCNEIFK